jgi:hypothetical protein
MEQIESTHTDLVTYAQKQLNSGLPLSSLYSTFDLESGSFRLLPEGVNFPNLSSGINKGYNSVSIATELITYYLAENISNHVIIEYASATKSDLWVKSHNLRYFTYGKYIYSVFNNADFTHAMVKKSVKSAISYQLIIGLFQHPNSINLRVGSEISTTHLQEIAQLTQIILFEVFDGEGILIWERQSRG